MSKNFGCGGCGPRAFGRRRRGNPQAAKAMRIMRSKGISLKEAWKVVKGGKASKSRGRRRRGSRRSRRGSRRSRRGSRRSRRGSRRSRRGSRRSRRGSRRSRRSRRRRRRRSRRSRRFGIVAGPGFKAQTSYSNAYAPYFGASEPFLNASNWWYPYAGGVAQSPQMLMTKPLAGYRGPGN